jgi:uncharacterized short protein YbdD (DUF466 family)
MHRPSWEPSVPPRVDAGIRPRFARIARLIERIVGAPDHEGYLAHMRIHHPERIPLSREAFARDALARRYDRPGSRCC